MRSLILDELQAHRVVLDEVVRLLVDDLVSVAETMVVCLRRGGKLLIFGNGGSAADAQHMAAEFVGRFRRERAGYAAVALTTDTSCLTAIANDYGYDRVFDRQVESLAREGDLLFGFSTSGNSPNVLSALRLGREIGCKSIGLSGRAGGKMAALCDHLLAVPSEDTARIQEMHITIVHLLCELVERELSKATVPVHPKRQR